VNFLSELGPKRHHKRISDKDHWEDERSLFPCDIVIGRQVWSYCTDNVLTSKELHIYGTNCGSECIDKIVVQNNPGKIYLRSCTKSLQLSSCRLS